MYRAYDHHGLVLRLSAYSSMFQFAFALGSARRLLDCYTNYMMAGGYDDRLMSVLHKRLQDCLLDRSEVSEVDSLGFGLRIREALPKDADVTQLNYALAEDAVLSTAAAVDVLLGVQESQDLDPQDTELETKILEHPHMQLELSRQARDCGHLELPDALNRIYSQLSERVGI
jgi:hypothetical protein